MARTPRLCAVLLLAAVPATALAQLSGTKAQEEDSATLRQRDALFDASTNHDRKSELVVHGIYQWSFGVGVGGRYSLPLIRDGVLPDLNESIALEGGVDFVLSTFTVAAPFLRISVEPRWTFHVIPPLDLYAKLGAHFNLQLGSAAQPVNPFGIQVAIGVVYRLLNAVSVRFETGVEGAKIGVGLQF